jgi:hydroxylamine reductase
MLEGLFTTVTNVNFDESRINDLIAKIEQEKSKLGGAENLSSDVLWKGDPDLVSLRSTLLLGLRGMAAYACMLGFWEKDPDVTNWFYKGMRALGEEHSVEEWLELLMAFGSINLKCMALLDEANTSTYGHPVPVKVSTIIEKGPFIVVSGHDLLDLKMLLEQTEGKGISIYTHGEMLPAHGYPELKKHAHLKGNFGTACRASRRSLTAFPALCSLPPTA